MKQGALSESMNNKESCTPSSRPNSSLVRIDSISINIDAAEQSKSDKCEHFTIRGYVSDNRKKNGAQRLLFSLDGDDANSEDINSRLPPMDVPKFRNWQCQSCLSEIDDEGASKDTENITVDCRRCSHRSLENVVAYLSKKLKQRPELGCGQCTGTNSTSEFTQKHMLDSALDLITGGLRENVLHSAASGSSQPVLRDSNKQLVTSKNVDEHQYQWLRPETISLTKFDMVDGDKLKGNHAACMELVHNHQNLNDSGGTGRRKPKKVRLLNELLDKDEKDAQPAVTGGFHTNEAAKVRCSDSGQKRNRKCREQDSRCSQMHNAGSSGGKGETRKAQDINIAFGNAEIHLKSTDERSDATIKQADKMLLGSKNGADGQKNYHHRSQKRNIDSCKRQVSVSTCQPFHGRETYPQHNNITPASQFKGKSNDTLNKAQRVVNVPAPADNSKELDGNSLLKEPMETIQIGHHTRSVQNDYSSKSHFLFSDGCLDTRKGTRCYVPHTENQNLRNDIAMQYMGESSSVYKSLVEKNMWQGTNSNSGLKRPNRGPCVGNKKPKRTARTEGPTDVHQKKFLPRNSNMKMVGSRENPEITNKFSDNMVQEVGTSDDIPMEIVELMAKNQYERRLHEVVDNHYMLQSGSNSKHDVVGRTTVLSNLVSQATQKKKSHLPNVRVISENDSGNGYMMQRPTGSTYGTVLSSQQELSSVLQYPALGSSKPDIFRKCKYDNNFAPEHRVSPRSRALYEAWQPASRQSDKTANAWPMIPPNNAVHMASVRQDSGLQPFDVGKVPTCSSYAGECRGLNNLSLAGFVHTINDFRPLASNTSSPNRVDSRPQMMGSPNPYDNETIPAMHLLSLMNGGIQSSAPTNKEAKAKRKTFDRSFSNDHLAKELSENSFGVGKSNNKFKQPSPYGYQSKVLQSDSSCQCSTPAPTFGLIVSSLPGDVGKKKGTQPSSHHTERTYLNRTSGGYFLHNENNGFKYQKSPLASTGGVTGQEPVPGHELSKHIFNPLWSAPGSSHSYMNGNISGYCNLTSQESYDTLKRPPGPGACCVNRNPMDFTAPGPGNEYMIGVEDLNFRNRTHIPYITRPMATNAFKQHRFTTFTTAGNRL